MAETITPPAHHRATVSGSATDSGADTTKTLVVSVGAVAAVLWLLGWVADVPVLTSVTMVTAGLLGFGAGALCSTRLRGSRFLAWSIAASMSYSALLSLAMVKANWWHPVAAAAVSQVLTLVLAVSWLWRHRGTFHPDRSAVDGHRGQTPRLGGPLRRGALVAAVAFTGIALGLAAADSSNTRIGWSGLLGSINPLWFVCVAVLSGLAVACAWRRVRSFPVVAGLLGTTLTLTPAIVYLSSRSQSAEKHIALTQLVESTGRLVSTESAYNGWPGFFSLTAWWAQAGHIDNLYGLAALWPTVLVLPRIAAVYALASRITSSRRAIYLAVTFELLVNCLGTDYYSPQSYGYVLALLLYGIALDRPVSGPLRAAALLGVSAAMTVTHQLTPFIALGATIVLVLFRLVQPWYLVVCIAVPIVAWAGVNVDTIRRYVSPANVGSASNFSLPSQQSQDRVAEIVHLSIYATGVGGALVGLLSLALIVRRRRRADIALAVTAAVGLGLVAVYAYGNEGIIRAVLFSIPWLCILAAMFVSSLRRRGAAVPVVAAVPVMLTATFLVGCFALDGGTVMRRSDVRAIDTAMTYARTHPNAYVLLMSLESGDTPTSGPTQPKNFHTARVQAATGVLTSNDPSVQRPTARGFIGLVLRLDKVPAGRPVVVFVLSSPAASIHDQQYGVSTSSQQRTVQQIFVSAPSATTELDEGGTALVRFSADDAAGFTG